MGEMNKTCLLAKLQSARWNWEFVLAQVDESRIAEPSMHGGWSVKDTVGHVSYYERWLLGWLEDAVRGRVRAATHRDLVSVDERNALVYAENKDRHFDEIMEEGRSVFERLYSLVQTLPESELVEPHRFERYIVPLWGVSQPLWLCIAGDSFNHYEEHAANVQAWLETTGSKLQKMALQTSVPGSLSNRESWAAG